MNKQLYNAAPYKNLSTVHQYLFASKAAKGCSFADIAKEINRDEVWTAAVFYGQAKPTPQDIERLASFFGDELQFAAPNEAGQWFSQELGKNWMINRGDQGPMPPTDPVIYRLYEGILVYGYPIKHIIQEKFGDGIMSLIDCEVHVDRKEDPKGDRVVLTFDGKFLPYATW